MKYTYIVIICCIFVLCSCKIEKCEEFYENGKLHFVGKSRNNKMIGKWYYYYPNGKMKFISEYSDGELVNFWDKDSIQTVKDGTGTAISYYPNGKIEKSVTFYNGKLHDKWEEWYSNGIKSMELEFFHGELVTKQ